MQIHTFWHILETSSARSKRDSTPLAVNVVHHLCRLDVGQVLAFAKIFYALDASLTRREVKEVCLQIKPQANAKDFIEFRAWVIFQGFEFYRLVNSAPDLLLSLADENSVSQNFSAVVVRAYERKTRKRDFYELPEIELIISNLPDVIL